MDRGKFYQRRWDGRNPAKCIVAKNNYVLISPKVRFQLF